MPDPELNLSPGERLWLDRKRRGETQAEAATRRGTHRVRQWQQETGREPVLDPPNVLPGPSEPERLQLLRRRRRLTLPDVAQALGVSRLTVMTWERRGDPRLAAWWRTKII